MFIKITPISFCCLILLAYSGESNASEQDYQCFVPGECMFSQHIEIVVSKDEFQCLESCQNNVNCTWFTFYPDDYGTCQLFASCGKIDDTLCPLCKTGQKECTIPEPVCWIQGHCLGNVTHTETNIGYYFFRSKMSFYSLMSTLISRLDSNIESKSSNITFLNIIKILFLI